MFFILFLLPEAAVEFQEYDIEGDGEDGRDGQEPELFIEVHSGSDAGSQDNEGQYDADCDTAGGQNQIVFVHRDNPVLIRFS
jgi:hypothetical protein|tara:strand:+ start:1078 stop:1323 length:246 start_codon:yes stop_codon:yes gene_type:complete